jgi:hypothetical protein
MHEASSPVGIRFPGAIPPTRSGLLDSGENATHDPQTACNDVRNSRENWLAVPEGPTMHDFSGITPQSSLLADGQNKYLNPRRGNHKWRNWRIKYFMENKVGVTVEVS